MQGFLEHEELPPGHMTQHRALGISSNSKLLASDRADKSQPFPLIEDGVGAPEH